MPSGEVRAWREKVAVEASPIDEQPELEQDAAAEDENLLKPHDMENVRRWTFTASSRSPRNSDTFSNGSQGMDSTHSYRNRPRASTMMRLGATGLPPTPRAKPWPTHRRSESDLGSRGRSLFVDRDWSASEQRGRQAVSRPPRSSVPPTFKLVRSDSSTGSASTVVQTSLEAPHSDGAREESRPHSGEAGIPEILEPGALQYLEDSPEEAKEAIQRSADDVAAASSSAAWRFAPPVGSAGSSTRGSPSRPSHTTTSPRSAGISSAASASSCSEMVDGDQDTDRSSSPERSINGNGNVSARTSPMKSDFLAAPEFREPRNLQELQELEQEISRQHHNRYGTPEMPRGHANLPHIAPRTLNPRSNHPYAMNLPRAEKLPLSGYELLASCLSGKEHCMGWHESDHQQQGQGHVHHAHRRNPSCGSSAASVGMLTPSPRLPHHQLHPVIKPIYRRFQALNHRILLDLQDELSVLEEQLHRLDTADTQARRVQNHIMPASRRGENPRGGELQAQKAEVLHKIEGKLVQYNQALASFSKTQVLPIPSTQEVENYRTYFAMENPISEMETRFLDCPYDLVSLVPPDKPSGPAPINAQTASRAGSSDLPLRNNYLDVNDEQDQPLDENDQTPVQGQNPFQASSPAPTILYTQQRLEPLRSPFATARPSPLSQPPTTTAHAHRRFGSNVSTRSPGLASCLSSSYPTEPAPPTSTMSLYEETDAKPEASSPSSDSGTTSRGDSVAQGVALGTAAILAPVAAFTFIPGFAPRMAIVLLVLALTAVFHSGWSRWSQGAQKGTTETKAGLVGGKELESKSNEELDSTSTVAATTSYAIMGGFSTRDLLICAGAYGGVMAVIAGAFT